MDEYIRNLKVCIDEKLIEHAIDKGKSIIELDILYNYQLLQISMIYRNPEEHYSKIMTLAYMKVTKC